MVPKLHLTRDHVFKLYHIFIFQFIVICLWVFAREEGHQKT